MTVQSEAIQKNLLQAWDCIWKLSQSLWTSFLLSVIVRTELSCKRCFGMTPAFSDPKFHSDISKFRAQTGRNKWLTLSSIVFLVL